MTGTPANLKRGPEEARLHARTLVDRSLVCDTTLPWTQYGSLEARNQTLPRYRNSGFDFVSLTLASDKEGPRELLHSLGRVRRDLIANGHLTLVESVAEVRKARQEGVLAVSLNVQGTNNLAGDINLVEIVGALNVQGYR